MDRIPGLVFRLGEFSISGRADGNFRGRVELICEITKVAKEEGLFGVALERFNGMKLFTAMTEEIVAALSDELDTTTEQLENQKASEQYLRDTIRDKDAEIAELRKALSALERDLGITD